MFDNDIEPLYGDIEYQSDECSSLSNTDYEDTRDATALCDELSESIKLAKIGILREEQGSTSRFNVDVPEFIPRESRFLTCFESMNLEVLKLNSKACLSKNAETQCRTKIKHKSTQTKIDNSSRREDEEKEVLTNEKMRDIRIDMLLEENKNLQEKFESLRNQSREHHMEIKKFVSSDESEQDLKVPLVLLQKKIEMLENKLHLEEKNLEDVKSLLIMQTVNHMNLQKFVISKHMIKCKCMIDDLNMVLPHLTSSSTPTVDECNQQLKNWRDEYEKAQHCLVIFNDYYRTMMNCVHRCNFTEIPFPPEIINEFVEHRDILHDNFMTTVNSLLKDIYFLQQQNQMYHKNYSQWWHSANASRNIPAPVQFYVPYVPQGTYHGYPDFQPKTPMAYGSKPPGVKQSDSNSSAQNNGSSLDSINQQEESEILNEAEYVNVKDANNQNVIVEEKLEGAVGFDTTVKNHPLSLSGLETDTDVSLLNDESNEEKWYAKEGDNYEIEDAGSYYMLGEDKEMKHQHTKLTQDPGYDLLEQQNHKSGDKLDLVTNNTLKVVNEKKDDLSEIGLSTPKGVDEELPEVVQKASSNFRDLFLYLRDRLPDVEQMDIYYCLKTVRQKLSGLSGKTRDAILLAVEKELFLQLDDY